MSEQQDLNFKPTSETDSQSKNTQEHLCKIPLSHLHLIHLALCSLSNVTNRNLCTASVVLCCCLFFCARGLVTPGDHFLAHPEESPGITVPQPMGTRLTQAALGLNPCRLLPCRTSTSALYSQALTDRAGRTKKECSDQRPWTLRSASASARTFSSPGLHSRATAGSSSAQPSGPSTAGTSS